MVAHFTFIQNDLAQITTRSKALAAINEARKKQAQSSHEAGVESTKAEANSKHDLRIDWEKKKDHSRGFEASYANPKGHAGS